MNFILHPYQKRFFLSLLLVAILAALFWTQSRYPALDEKALMSGAIQLEDPLSFEAKYQLSPEMSVLERIGYSTLNWINTNRKGMTFGVLIAAAFLTLSATLRRRSFKGGWLNSLLGMVIGAPLGVCVNCAAPIAKGLYASGARAETTLSMMVASPTLNIVVLTMLFSIMPFWMAVTKIALSLFVILIAIPVICRYLPSNQLEVTPPPLDVPTATGWEEKGASESFLKALQSTIVNYLKNLWYIIRLTVPLMLLAGFLGAIVATLVPHDMIVALPFGIMAVVLIALFGVFLPVPIAFDVVVVGALLSAGLAPGFVMTLLFTLGIFSVYSFFIVAQAISLRAASMLALTIAVLGMGAGIGADRYHKWQSDRALDLLRGGLNLGIGAAYAQDGGGMITNGDAVTVTATPFSARSPAADTPFSRVEAWHLGIDKPIEFSFDDMWPPFWEGRSLSSGDIDRDGDIDLIIASTSVGLYIYTNDGAGQFARQVFDLGALADRPVFNAALVDITGDGWLDLFITTFRQGNFIVENNTGTFDFQSAQPVANRDDAVLTLALSFGDMDADGDLDAAIGNWAAGWYRRVPGEESRNRLIFNDNGLMDGSAFTELPGIPGETLSILMSDINADHRPDLIVGNDFEIPDYFYLSTDDGGIRMVNRQDGLIPHVTTTTMAVKTADLHNDGRPEIYLAQIAGRSSGVSETLKMQHLSQYCDAVERDEDRAVCLQNMEIKTWYKSGNNFDPTYAPLCETLDGAYRDECKAMLIKDLAIQRDDGTICDLIPAAQPRVRDLCTVHFRPIRVPSADEQDAAIPQVLRSNVLLEYQEDSFADMAGEQGLDVGGWSWDTKIADFDNDGFQDVYIVNGTWVPNEVSPSNLFFHNNGSGGFEETSGPFGLEDYLMTAAATVFDIEGDGDQDVITHPVNGPLQVFMNNSQTGNAISFTFADARGNHYGIGNTVEITLPDGSMQSRELQSGGGFMSFDAPVAHFGLGAFDRVEAVVIHWSNGGETRLTGGLDAGAVYKVAREN